MLSRQAVQWHHALLREQFSRGIVRSEDIRCFMVCERRTGQGEEFISSVRDTNTLRQRIWARRKHRDASCFRCREQRADRLREKILSLKPGETVQDEQASGPQGLHHLFVPTVQAVLRWRPQPFHAGGVEALSILFAGMIVMKSDPEAWFLHCLDQQHNQLRLSAG